MKRTLSLLLVLSLVLGMASFAAAELAFYDSSAQGFASLVRVKVNLEIGRAHV